MEYTVHELIQMIPSMADQHREEIKRLPVTSEFKTAVRFFDFMSQQIEKSQISKDTWMVVYYTMKPDLNPNPPKR